MGSTRSMARVLDQGHVRVPSMTQRRSRRPSAQGDAQRTARPPRPAHPRRRHMHGHHADRFRRPGRSVSSGVLGGDGRHVGTVDRSFVRQDQGGDGDPGVLVKPSRKPRSRVDVSSTSWAAPRFRGQRPFPGQIRSEAPAFRPRCPDAAPAPARPHPPNASSAPAARYNPNTSMLSNPMLPMPCFSRRRSPSSSPSSSTPVSRIASAMVNTSSGPIAA